MGWFDSQIKQRKQNDDEVFKESFASIAGSIIGKKLIIDIDDKRKLTQDAILDILKFYHIKMKEVPKNIDGLDEQLEYLMRPHGIMRRNVKLHKSWYKDAIGAFLGFRQDDNSVIALIPHKIYGYKFYDVKTKKYIRLNSKTEKLIKPEAISFYKPLPLRGLTTTQFLRYVLENFEFSDILFLSLITFLITILGIFLPKLNNIIFSNVIKSEDLQFLTVISVFMLCLSISSILFQSIKQLIIQKIITKMNIFVQSAIMMRIISLPVDFFKKYSSGELASFLDYISILSNMIISSVLTIGISAVFALIYISQVYIYAPFLLFSVFMVLISIVLFSAISAFFQTKLTMQQIKLETKENAMSYSFILGIQKIKLSGAEKRAFARWANLYANSAKLMYNPPFFLKINTAVMTSISLIGSIVIYYYSMKNNISVANYYAFHIAYSMMSSIFLEFSNTILMTSKIKPILEIIRPILDKSPEISQGKHVISKISGNVELNNISFRYKDNTPNILENFSLKISPGQYVAIVGKTGCGKSTLIRLLLGFETPQKGAIYYDAKDMNTIDLKSLRKNIGVVMQNDKLFQGSIYSNIKISAPWISVEEAWNLAEIVGIAEDIEKMPMGMNTFISEGNGGISAGQRQRIAIARAIASKPKIFMFDEATSALDNITQKKISDYLNTLRCTRIVIAHRLSTIRQCDRILVLEKGSIIEDGSYDELVEKNGFFAELIERQNII